MRDCEVYADCAASAPILKVAWDVMSKAYAEGWGNPNSVHTAGRDARKKLEEAREIIAHCINAKPEEIAFTPSATAACEVALDFFDCRWPYTNYRWSNYEHKAVFSYLSGGYYDEAAPIDGCYAHMLANNETGEIYYGKVRELAQKYSVFTDATAAVGQMPVDVQDLGVAALAAGGHKFGAFPGVGFVYIRGGVKDEDTFPGTPPVALAVAMAEALFYRTLHRKEAQDYLYSQQLLLANAVCDIPGGHINTPVGEGNRLPNILSVRFDGVNARELLTMLDVNGVCASAGSACTADSDDPSRVLLASGLTEEQALSTIRLSFCPETTPDEFSFVADALRRSVAQLRKLSK